MTATSEIMRRAEAAAYLRVAPATMAGWAYRGGGPPFSKTGRLTLYRRDDLDAWLAERRVSSTAEHAARAPVSPPEPTSTRRARRKSQPEATHVP